MIKFAHLIENNDEYAIIDFGLKDGCNTCESRCEKNLLNLDFFKNKSTQVIVHKRDANQNSIQVFDENRFFSKPIEKGSKVGVEFNDSQMLLLTIKLYGLPLLAMLGGLLSCLLMFKSDSVNQDLLGIFGLFFGFALSYLFIKFFQPKHKLTVRFF